MSIEKISILSLNPNFLGKLIQSFLVGYNQPCDFKLLFYVLPIILYKPSREKLLTANNRSRIETLFQSQVQMPQNKDVKLSGKTRLAGFMKRFEELTPYTKQALIILSTERKISFDKKVKILADDNYNNYSGKVKEWMRSSYYLGVVFSKTTMEHLYFFLGVEECQ